MQVPHANSTEQEVKNHLQEQERLRVQDDEAVTSVIENWNGKLIGYGEQLEAPILEQIAQSCRSITFTPPIFSEFQDDLSNLVGEHPASLFEEWLRRVFESYETSPEATDVAHPLTTLTLILTPPPDVTIDLVTRTVTRGEEHVNFEEGASYEVFLAHAKAYPNSLLITASDRRLEVTAKKYRNAVSDANIRIRSLNLKIERGNSFTPPVEGRVLIHFDNRYRKSTSNTNAMDDSSNS